MNQWSKTSWLYTVGIPSSFPDMKEECSLTPVDQTDELRPFRSRVIDNALERIKHKMIASWYEIFFSGVVQWRYCSNTLWCDVPLDKIRALSACETVNSHNAITLWCILDVQGPVNSCPDKLLGSLPSLQIVCICTVYLGGTGDWERADSFKVTCH